MNGRSPERQAAALSLPDRVQLLSLVLSDPRGEVSAASLGGSDRRVSRVAAQLEELAAAGLLEAVDGVDGRVYRPTYDALARFGALLGTVDLPIPADRPDELLARIAADLVGHFTGSLSPETVRRFVDESYTLLASRATVRTHLPLLTARFAAERLTALATSEATRGSRVDVLFVCTHNAGRSQLAAAALRTRAGAGIHVRTAGSMPAARVEPAVLAVIERRGWVPALEFPKPLTDEVVRAADYVVTMGCGDACPVVPGRVYLDWSVPDPLGKSAVVVDEIAEDVDRRVRDLLARIDEARVSGVRGGR